MFDFFFFFFFFFYWIPFEAGRTETLKKYIFNDTLSTFYLLLYGAERMVKNHPESEKGNPLPPLLGLLFRIIRKGSFICSIPQTGYYIPRLFQAGDIHNSSC